MLIAATPQTDALVDELLEARQIPAVAFPSVARARELEREVMVLRQALAAMPANAVPSQQWQDDIARLLSELLLFRLALEGKN